MGHYGSAKRMRSRPPVRSVFLLTCLVAQLAAQELQPRAYIPTPVGLNYFGFGYSNNKGGVLFDPTLPVEDLQVKAHIPSIMFAQTLDVAGRTAQLLVVAPYVVADLEGGASGVRQSLYRSGLGDATFRYAMNIYGAPAMSLKEYAEYRQKTIIGASITVIAPIGQYDPNRLVNISTNRWEFKPEVGVSRALGKWTIEGAAGVWLFTANNRYLGGSARTQDPLGSLQFHVVRFLPHRIWLAGDWTFFTGGRSQVDGRDRPDYMGNTRLGVTAGIAITRRQAIKVTYFNGVWSRVGSDMSSFGVSYSVIWRNGRRSR